MQLSAPSVVRRRARACPALALWAFCLAGPAGAEPTPPRDPEIGYTTALGPVTLATGRVRGALALRAERAAAATRIPTPDNCRRLQEAAALLAEQRDELAQAWGALAQRSAPWPDRAAAAREALARLEAVRIPDQRWAAAWAARCEGLPPVAEPPAVVRPRHRALCADLSTYGSLQVLIAGAARVLRPAGGLWVARRLARDLEDDFDFLFVLVKGSAPDDGGQRASVHLERGTPGLGQSAPTPPEALPGWRRLRSVIVLGADAGLRRGPSLRGLALAFANRLAWPGCSPGPGAGWGYSDAAGQLGGAAALEEVGRGRFRLASLRPEAPIGLVANGGNAVPYASIELYLMGLLSREEVRPVNFLRDPVADPDGLVSASGRCVLDAATLAARYGERPLDLDPWRVGVVVVSEARLDAASLDHHLAEALAWSAAGPDEDPALYNFHEATGGRGRVDLVAPRRRPGRPCEPGDLP